MAVMSFAHLKKKTKPVEYDPEVTWERSRHYPSKSPQQKQTSQACSPLPINRKKPVPVEIPVPAEVVPAEKIRTTYRRPAIMMTARIIGVDLCRGCPRFLLSAGKIGNPYGRCLRKGEIDSEDERDRPVRPP